MPYLHRCVCGREVAHGAPMASHRRACPAAKARRAEVEAEEAAILAAVAATVCPKCDAAPGEPCTEPGRRPGTRMPLSSVATWRTHHYERHIAERRARVGY